jgi:hypothetical protein
MGLILAGGIALDLKIYLFSQELKFYINFKNYFFSYKSTKLTTFSYLSRKLCWGQTWFKSISIIRFSLSLLDYFQVKKMSFV